jgi:bla regulator protein blaR1
MMVGLSELSIVVKTTVVLVLGVGAARIARHAAASTRHFILTATFVALLILPVAISAMPDIAVGVPIPSAVSSQAFLSGAARPSTSASAAADSSDALATAGRSSAGRARPLITGRFFMRIVWIAGAAFLLVRLAAALWRFERLRRRGLPWAVSQPLVASLTTGARNRPVQILLHEDLAAPATCGWMNPAVLLPPEAPEWNEADVRRAVVHELEHVKRGDWAIQLMARATCALFWFHPLVWIAFRQLGLEAERACDDAVLREDKDRTDYAAQLVQLARRMSNAPAQPALAMANRSDLSARVTAILDGTQPRGRLGALPAIAVATLAVLLVTAVAPLRAVAVSSSSNQIVAGQAVRPVTRGPRRVVAALDRALLEAAEDGDLDGISSLVAAGANVNAAIDGDGSPLIAAARSGSLAAVRLLLDHGADPNLAVIGDGNPIIMAAHEGHVEIVDLLLNRGASIDQMVQGDENALIQASGEGQLAVVKLLVARGADVNARVWADVSWRPAATADGEWRTPLSMARSRGHEAVVAFLLSAGARE